LSGGEQSRAILAKVFSKPANVLVLDEPTNDLDIETLELLEDILLNFEGTVLLVSHDRQFMDNVVTSLMVFEGSGHIGEYVGGYSDWIRNGGSLTEIEEQQAATAKPEKKQASDKRAKKPDDSNRKAEQQHSQKEKKELEQQLKLIERLENKQQELEATMAEASFYTGEQKTIDEVLKQAANTQAELDAAYRRWEELEGS
jgi:ABC transport system ATP-binding/permease protein